MIAIRAQAIQKFDFEYFATLDPGQQQRLLKCLKTGWENPDSGLGCYAMSPSDYQCINQCRGAPRHRRDASSMAWQCGSLATGFGKAFTG